MITKHTQQDVPLKKLKGATYNPRTMPTEEMERLIRSLSEFGFVQPIVARRDDGLVVGGHQRLAAYRELLKRKGLAEAELDAQLIPTILVDDLSDEKAKLLNVALNKISGEWDYGKLSDLFASIDLDTTGLDLEVSGFTSHEVEDILNLSRMSEELAPAAEDELDVDAALDAQARVFKFKLEHDKEAQLCQSVLKDFGMTGPSNAGAALLAALKAARAWKQANPERAPPEVKQGKKKSPTKKAKTKDTADALPAD